MTAFGTSTELIGRETTMPDYDDYTPASPERGYPCDGPEGRCPYIVDDSQATGMYFCRDHCGLGVDD